MKETKLIVGGIVWLCAVQYFVVEAIVQHAWNIQAGARSVYSMRFNYISDLGANVCTYFPKGSAMYVCSPFHALMNISFMLSGIIAVVGSSLIFQHASNSDKKGSSFISTALIAIIIGSIGNIGVGLFPETTNLTIHGSSAGLIFILTNIGMILFGIGMLRSKQKATGIYSIASGSIALLALVVLVTKSYQALGVGLVERFVSYPFTVWLVVMGISTIAGYFESDSRAFSAS